MIAIVENELGYPHYEAVGQLKRTLSSQEHAGFRFTGGGPDIASDVARGEFESWIAADIARISACVEHALI